MNAFYFRSLFIAIGFLFLQSCGTSGGYSSAYLKTKNPNITWMDRKQIKSKTEVPQNLSYIDENYLYCWENAKKGNSSKGMPIFYKIDINTLEISKSSKGLIEKAFKMGDKKNSPGLGNSLSGASPYGGSNKLSKSVTKGYENAKSLGLNVFWNKNAGWVIYDGNSKKKEDEYKAFKISFDEQHEPISLFTIESQKSNSEIDNGFYLNSDSTKLTFYSAEYLSKEDKLIFNVKCFDFATMAELWKHKYTYPQQVKRRKDISDISVMVNKKGEPHFLVKNYLEKRKEKKKNDAGEYEANYNFKYYVLTELGKVNEYIIDTKGDFIQSIEFPFTNLNNPIVVAYTYEKSNFKELKSIVFKQINVETKEVITLREVKLNIKKMQLFNETTGKKISQASGFKGIRAIAIQDILQTEDNSIYVIGEENELIQKCNGNMSGDAFSSGASSFGYSGYGMSRCKYYWESGNILVTKISSDGKESWTKIIPKSQKVETSYGLNETKKLAKVHSHKSMIIGNKLHLFFNDTYKNYKGSGNSIKIWNGPGCVLSHVILNSDGNYEIIEALGKKDHPKVISINTIQKMNDNSIFLFDYKTIGKLNIDN